MTSYYRKPCSGCGARIPVTPDRRHVISAYTGSSYCETCTTKGLPPIAKRPFSFDHERACQELRRAGDWFAPRRNVLVFDDLVARGYAEGKTVTEADVETRLYKLTELGYGATDSSSLNTPSGGRRPQMASNDETKTEKSTEVLDALLERVKNEVPNVELLEKGGYVTVKSNGKTVGYINGKFKLRIDGVVAGGERQKQFVNTMDEVDAGVSFLQATAKVVADKLAAKQQETEAKAAAKAEKAAAKEAEAPAAESAPVASDEVTPDPKPAPKPRRGARANA